MIPIKYKLNKDLIARTAVILNWNLKTIKSNINLINIDNSNRMVNAKSLVGLLSG
jgi:phosphotransferase system HPr-like phosphotransfer protein